MQISTVTLILLEHHAHVYKPNRDKWKETQAFQGKESSNKFTETSEASFYLCSSFSHYLHKLRVGNSLQDFQTEAVEERAEAKESWVSYNHFASLYFCDPVKRTATFNLGLPR